ncbi:MAG TPA: hypothetical protein VL240_08490 [Candidatus Binatia bacterium]|nr:hypothetical protein [Candidatus Binatia bacterium]
MAPSAQPVVDPRRELLRHTLATVAYRGGKALRGAPVSFANFGAADSPRTPARILAHIGDLMEWALSNAQGNQKWTESTPLPWDEEVNRFHAALKALDDFLASGQPLAASPEALFQGPIADSLTHIGQIAMLRRMAGCQIKAENYYKAEIVLGRVGAEQASPKKSFD